MAINYELINKGGISLGTNFELLSEKPLDSRLVIPSLDGLQNYIDNAAAYEGMIVYDQTTKKTYQVERQEDGSLGYKEFASGSNVYIGRDEPVNVPAGFMWVDTSDEIKLIKFYIKIMIDVWDNSYTKGDVLTFYAEEGMTLRAWTHSPYNIDGWICVEEGWEEGDHQFGLVNATQVLALCPEPPVYWDPEELYDCDEVIIPNHNYTAYSAP